MTQPQSEQSKTAKKKTDINPVSKPTQSEIEILIRARYPILYVITWEEYRLVQHVLRIAEKLNKKVYEWSITTGLVPAGTSINSQRHQDTATQDPLVALDGVVESMEPALYIFKDFHPFIKGHNMSVIRRLREISATLKNTYKTIILVSPMFQFPEELEKDLTVVDFDLPGEQELTALLGRIIEEVKDNPKLNVKTTPQIREKIVHALLGLTLAEAENVLAKTLVQNRALNEQSVEVIHGEKKQIIRKTGLLEYYDSHEKFNTIGGLDVLKEWLKRRAVAFTDEARKFGLSAPKGVLLLGVQGCGKSLMAKAVSNIWKLPLLRFDIGRVFGSLVGSSEENIRRAIRVSESISPCILWLDEIDKAFRGSRSSSASTDGGTSARVFGAFLTWMSEKTKPVFVVATANDVSALPPELLRKGRFDEIFFVDLPGSAERKEILRVHLAKRRIDPAKFDLDRLASASVGYSGAEIEEAVTSAMFDMFYDRKKMTTESIEKSINETVPLSKTMSEDMEKLREWANGRARMATSPQLASENTSSRRDIELQ